MLIWTPFCTDSKEQVKAIELPTRSPKELNRQVMICGGMVMRLGYSGCCLGVHVMFRAECGPERIHPTTGISFQGWCMKEGRWVWNSCRRGKNSLDMPYGQKWEGGWLIAWIPFHPENFRGCGEIRANSRKFGKTQGTQWNSVGCLHSARSEFSGNSWGISGKHRLFWENLGSG